MMLGLGVYLPFYMSFTAFLGAMVKVVFDQIVSARLRSRGLDDTEASKYRARMQDSGLLIASGLLGGESVMGIIIALVTAAGALL
jgi:uncharacterized oligopeptide transporter (OPT) family protein